MEKGNHTIFEGFSKTVMIFLINGNRTKIRYKALIYEYSGKWKKIYNFSMPNQIVKLATRGCYNIESKEQQHVDEDWHESHSE